MVVMLGKSNNPLHMAMCIDGARDLYLSKIGANVSYMILTMAEMQKMYPVKSINVFPLFTECDNSDCEEKDVFQTGTRSVCAICRRAHYCSANCLKLHAIKHSGQCRPSTDGRRFDASISPPS